VEPIEEIRTNVAFNRELLLELSRWAGQLACGATAGSRRTGASGEGAGWVMVAGQLEALRVWSRGIDWTIVVLTEGPAGRGLQG
jgi:hypothetical protein